MSLSLHHRITRTASCSVKHMQAFKRPDADLAAKKLAQSLLSKILGSFVAKLTALAQVG